MSNFETCVICGKTDFKNCKAFVTHLRIHRVTSKDYYLFYIDYTKGNTNRDHWFKLLSNINKMYLNNL